MDIIKGKLWIINEEDVNTDLIFAGKYTYEQLTPEEMGKKALEDFDKDFHNKLSPGDFIVSGKNFGCGSSREQAVTCFKGVETGRNNSKIILTALLQKCNQQSSLGN